MSASYPTAPKTFTARSAGQTIASAHINDLQDEVNAIETGLLSGTAPLSSSNTTVNNLSVAGTITATTQPRCVAYNNATQVITAGNTTALALNSEDVDVGVMHDTVTNNSRITIVTTGLYLVTGFAQMQASGGAAEASLILRKNGTTQLQEAKFTPASSNYFASGTVSMLLSLVATDYVELVGKATTNTVNFGTANRQDATTFSVVRVW